MTTDAPTATALIEPVFGPKEIREARERQRLLDAKIVMAEEAVNQLLRERRAVEDSLWMPVSKDQLKALLEDGSYGKSLDVMSDIDSYRHRSWARLNDSGEMTIGGFHRHDHFRADTLYVHKDLGRFS